MTEPTAVTGFLINLLPVPSIIFFSISVRISSNHNLSGSAVVIIMSCGCRRRRHDVAESSEIFPSCCSFVKLLPRLFLTIRHLLNEGFCNQWMNLSAPSTGQLIQILGDFLNAHCWINAHQHFWGSVKKKKTCQRFLMNRDKIKTIIVTNTHKTGLKQKDEKHWSQIIQPDTNTTNMMLFSDGSSVQSCLDVPAEVIVHMEDACQ